MKKIYLLMLAVIGIMTSCSNDDIIEDNIEQSKQVFIAETETPGDTRTSLSPERNIYWTEGDHIAIFNKCTVAEEYKLTTGAGSTNGTFNPVRTSSGDSYLSDTKLSRVIAVYPYGKNYVVTNTSETSFKIENVEIPAEQTYVAESFSQGSMPMVAVTENNKLKFKNVGALVKLNITSSAPDVGISMITIENCDAKNQAMHGDAIIEVDNNGKIVSTKMVRPYSRNDNIIKLGCNNVRLSNTLPKSFYIVIPPMNFTNGFVITVYDEANQIMLLKSKPCDIKRNQIMVMPPIVFKPLRPTEGKWIDLGLPSGIKWASCNVGAKSPEEYGNYYSWGETTIKTDYRETTDSYYHQDANGKWIFDNLGNISAKVNYDAARANWGGAARMPTIEEIRVLYDNNNCIWTWTTLNGVNGYLVRSVRNGNSIFLPAAGRRVKTGLYGADEYGLYWSSTPNEGNDRSVYGLYLLPDGYYECDWIDRCYGHPVRPVSN